MKKITLFGLCAVMALSLSACGTKSQVNSANPGAGGANQAGGRRMPDYGQPKTPPSLSGIVESITGNSVQVLKIERPSTDKGQAGEASTTSSEAKTKLPSMGATNAGGRPGGFGGFSGGNRGGGQGGANQDPAARIAALKKMGSVDEEVIIPVGIQMLKRDKTDTKNRTMVAATLEDIKQDSMLTIWFDTTVTDRNVAKFVMVN